MATDRVMRGAQQASAEPRVPATGGERRLSKMAEGLVGSEILKIAADIRELVASGSEICNLTVGDFRPTEFRIPEFLEMRITQALRAGETNYPPSDGMPALRQAVAALFEHRLGLKVPLDSVLVASGARPVIYAGYRAVVDPDDVVVYPVPSWNNNHYCHLCGAREVPVASDAANAFLPTREALEPAVRGARLLALNSPLNPTGTAFTREGLEGICDLVLEENGRRKPGERPLYVLFDQVYWMLTFGGTRHFTPVALRPAMAPYTLFVDGISKPFAATGLRVGWAVVPPDVRARMADILGHMGAWAPRPEQVATAALLGAAEEVDAYHARMKRGVEARLQALHSALMELRAAGQPVEAIEPMGAIYLTARFALNGRTARDGSRLETNEQIRRYLLREAGLAVVPFQAFGMHEESGWFRLSVGAVSPAEIEAMRPRLRRALEALQA